MNPGKISEKNIEKYPEEFQEEFLHESLKDIIQEIPEKNIVETFLREFPIKYQRKP